MTKATKATISRLSKLNTRAGELIKNLTVEANNVEDLISDGFSEFECNVQYGPNGMVQTVWYAR